MTNLIHKCIRNALTKDKVNILHFNSVNKFNKYLENSKHNYYLTKYSDVFADNLNIYQHNPRHIVQYDLIMSDCSFASYKDMLKASQPLHIPCIHIIDNISHIRPESMHLFLRDTQNDLTWFVNKETFDGLNVHNNYAIGMDNWDEIITNYSNEAYKRWR